VTIPWSRKAAELRTEIEAELDRRMPPESEPPHTLHRAMRYSLFAGGKRLRPIFCMLAAEAAGGEGRAVLAPAAAIELLHTYTLIHDDLPAMDNDDLRRGRPTAHRVFGEANAILAGDALLTLAFEWLAESPAPPPYPPGALALELARAAGSRGVAGGQYEDLAAEGRPCTAEQVEFIHRRKTAALVAAACRMGAIAVGAPEAVARRLGEYGEEVGLAFQIADDILNATSTPEQLGKAVGSDAARGKATYVALFGIAAAAQRARELAHSAIARLEGLPGPTAPLAALARYAAERDR
jgi:geranylgeranyl diphosphate synthase type II